MALKRSLLNSMTRALLSKSYQFNHRSVSNLIINSLKSPRFFSTTRLSRVISSSFDVMRKAFVQRPLYSQVIDAKELVAPVEVGFLRIHTMPSLKNVDEGMETSEKDADVGDMKAKRKKLKGKRAVVRWLKFFRWKKKKEYERMTAEEKILYKLRKAQKKEERLVEALKKLEPKESSETTHDPEILTPEEHFFFLKMGLKCKNYVPVGRRGIYQGVILNMHLHWKKHQTLKVIVKTFSPEEVKEIASELARLTGGIVLEIHEENTIIMYRGKNYTQPPTEIMSPRVTLSRKKALDKSKCRDGLRAVRKYIPQLEKDLELLQAWAKNKVEHRITASGDTPKSNSDGEYESSLSMQVEKSEKMKEIMEAKLDSLGDDTTIDLDMASDSEDLSDLFETDSDTDSSETAKLPLYLDQFEKFPSECEHEKDLYDFRRPSIGRDDVDSPTLDEVDRVFLRAASILKKKNR